MRFFEGPVSRPKSPELRNSLRSICLILAVGLCTGFAPERPSPEDLFSKRRVRIQRAGMAALTTWGTGNMVAGTALWLTTPADRSARYFHQMNALWNTVNVTLGVIGLVGSRRDGVSTPIEASVQRSRKAQQIFAINLALDFGYITAGALTWDIGASRQSLRAVGYGQSVVLQGGFLLIFDAVMLGLHQRHLERWFARQHNLKLQLGPATSGWGLQVTGRF